MRELLDNSSQRMIRILEILLEHEGWTTFANLSSAVGASERTIAKDISLLKEQWVHHLNIDVSKKYGVRLQNQNIANIGKVFTDIFNNSVALHWIKELLFHPNNTIEFYENMLFVSRSTLIRLLPKINRYLSTKGMTIQCKNNMYQFLGEDEQYLRDFSASFLLELYGIDLAKFDLDIDLEVISELILSVLEKNIEPREFTWFSKDDISIIYQIMFYIVSLVREEKGYTLKSPYPVEQEISEKYIDYIHKHFPNVYVDNLRSIHQHIFNRYNGWTSKEEAILVRKEISEFFERFFSAVSFSPNEDIKQTMHYILKFMYFNTKFRPFETSELFDRIYYFSQSLKRTNSNLYQAVEKNLKTFSLNINLDMSSDLSNVLFWICLICPDVTQIAISRTALIISDFGTLHAQYLLKIITNFFNNKIPNLHVDIALHAENVTQEIIDGYDVLITTISHPTFFHRNMVLINDTPNTNDFCEIHKAILKE